MLYRGRAQPSREAAIGDGPLFGITLHRGNRFDFRRKAGDDIRNDKVGENMENMATIPHNKIPVGLHE